MAYQPKSYRKFVATAATATLVASAIAPVAGAASNFTDVAPKYKDAVDYLVANNITQGATATTFGTHENIKRGDLAIWLAKALKLDTASAPASGFADTKGTRYDASVSVLKAKGIVSGKSETSYEPSAFVTRGEMAIMLSRAYELTTDEKAPFTDMGAYAPYINGLYAYDITTGKTPETFGTALNITRGDLAIFLKRAAEVVKTAEVKSVTPLNAKEVQVVFTQAVDKTEAETEAKYAINGANPSDAKLAADGKTVTLTFATTEIRDAVLVVEPIKTAKDSSVKTLKYTSVYSYEDTARPTVTSVTYDNYYTAKIWFNEPIKDEGTIQISDSNAVATHVEGDKFITVNLANANVAMDKNIAVTIVGAKDFSDNLVSPNPVVVNVTKTKSDTVKPEVSSVDVQDTTRFSVKFTEALSANPTITINGTDVAALGGTISQDSTDKSKYNVTLTTAQTGVKTVAVAAGYTDISGNAGAAFSKLVEFKADSTAPAYVSHEVKTISNKQYLVVTFNEEVAHVTGKTVSGTYVDGNQVTRTVSDLGTVTAHDANNDGKNEAVKVELTGKNAGAYSVTLKSGFVKDLAGNDSAAKAVTFTLGSASDADKPGVSAVDVTPGKVTVRFSEDVSAATALNLANYKVEGESIFTSAIFKDNQYTVELTVREGSITVEGLRTVWVGNVKDVNGNTMDAYSIQKSFTENVKPTISGAKLTAADTVTVSFSEAMTEANLEDSTADFKIKVDGSEKTISTLTYNSATKSVDVKFTTAVTDLSKPIVLEVLSGNNVVDSNNNALATTGTVAVTQ